MTDREKDQDLLYAVRATVSVDHNLPVVVEHLTTLQVDKLADAVALQELFWPIDMVTSRAQLAAAILNGGSVIGAFLNCQLIGFCYAFPGYDGQEAYLCSHMMAIHPDYRNQGIGMRLKSHQRTWALERGYSRIVWTFDPFETRNGYLNLCKLGGTVRKYIPAVYGNDLQNLSTDRFQIQWELLSKRVQCAMAGQVRDVIQEEISFYPSLLTYTLRGSQLASVKIEKAAAEKASTAVGYLLPVPANIHQLKQENIALVAEWQNCLRRVCSPLFEVGYQVTALARHSGLHHDYVIEKM